MKAKQIRKYFEACMSESNKKYQGVNGEMAVLYGSDEVKINLNKSIIRLPDTDWLPFYLDGGSPEYEWIAILKMGNEWEVVFGCGDPYSSEMLEILPSSNGEIYAVPYSMRAEVSNRYPAPFCTK